MLQLLINGEAVDLSPDSSITIDEAHTYWAFVGRPWPTHWYPAANNHVLNSMLMRLAVALLTRLVPEIVRLLVPFRTRLTPPEPELPEPAPVVALYSRPPVWRLAPLGDGPARRHGY